MTEPTPPNGKEKEESLLALVARLEAAIAKYNSFDVVAWVLLHNSTINPENYSESSSKGAAHNIEYVSLQVLRHPFNNGDQLHPDNDLPEIHELLSAINLGATFERAFSERSAQQEGDQDELRTQHQMHEAHVRIPGYPIHQEHILNALFDPFAKELREACGFAVDDAVRLSDGVLSLLNQRMRGRMELADTERRRLLKHIRDLRAGRVAAEPRYPADLIRSLLTERWSGESRQVKRLR